MVETEAGIFSREFKQEADSSTDGETYDSNFFLKGWHNA